MRPPGVVLLLVTRKPTAGPSVGKSRRPCPSTVGVTTRRTSSIKPAASRVCASRAEPCSWSSRPGRALSWATCAATSPREDRARRPRRVGQRVRGDVLGESVHLFGERVVGIGDAGPCVGERLVGAAAEQQGVGLGQPGGCLSDERLVHVGHHPPAAGEAVAAVLIGRTRSLVDAVERDELRECEPHRGSVLSLDQPGELLGDGSPPVEEAKLLVTGARRRVAVPHDHPVVGAVGMVAQGDLRGHRHGLGRCRPPSTVDRVREHDPLAHVDGEEAGVEVRRELDPVVAHRGHERAARDGVQPLDSTARRSGQPPHREARRDRSTRPTPRRAGRG